MLRVALTGGIGTGKSYVLEQLRARGIPTLDADVLAHGVMAAGTEASAAIAERFGPDIIAADGSVDRTKLGGIVFVDAGARRDLEAIVHPAVYRAIEAGLRAFELTGDTLAAVVDIPLLFESGHAEDFDRVMVTACPPGVQVERLLGRGMTEEEARQRIAAQWPTNDKAARADFVIWTGGTFAETNRQIEHVVEVLRFRGRRL